MNLEDLWIGDELLIISSGIQGTFIGEIDGKARIKVGEKIIRVKPQNLKPVEEPVSRNPVLDDLEKETQESLPTYEQKINFKPEIDLHIEKLQNEKKNDNPIAILEFQLRKLTEFMDQAVAYRIPRVSIIHGKGTGALRMEVYNILEEYPEKVSVYPINNDGGTLVYLKY